MKALKMTFAFIGIWFLIYLTICGGISLLFWMDFYTVANSVPTIMAGVIPISITSGIIVDSMSDEKLFN
mgnify:FL=1